MISIEQAVAAPYCGLLLADAGARVIKVERPEGDFARDYDRGANGESTFFAWLNRGKESVCLDFNQPRDCELLHKMLASADVLLSNLAPGALARKGFIGSRLREHNPALICCEINGYGNSPQALGKKAYDFLVQAEVGLCSVTGSAAEPARVGVSICDLASGLTANAAILRALIQRAKSGIGVDLSISMFDVMADWMNMPLLAHRYGSTAPQRMGLTHALLAPYGSYASSDGQVLISVQNNREWRKLCEEVLQHPSMADDPRFTDNQSRVTHRDAMDEVINGVFESYSSAQLLDFLETANIACASLNGVAQLADHPLLRKQPISFAGATIEVADLPVRHESPRAQLVPSLDQHGRFVRAEFG